MNKKLISLITIALYAIVVVSTFAQPQVGVKTDDWVKLNVIVSGAPSGSLLPTWMRVEFLTVEGPNATIRFTMHMADGTDQNQTMNINIMTGSGGSASFQGLVIPANVTTGQSVYITGYGSVTITGESTRTYCGASRTVVYTSFSSVGYQITYYWDKLTGVILEASQSMGDMVMSVKTTETNMWEGQPFDPIFYVLIIAVIAIVIIVLFFTIRSRKKPTEA